LAFKAINSAAKTIWTAKASLEGALERRILCGRFYSTVFARKRPGTPNPVLNRLGMRWFDLGVPQKHCADMQDMVP